MLADICGCLWGRAVKPKVRSNPIHFQVLVPKDENLLGKMVQVEITETGKHYMKCRLLGDAVRPKDVPPPLLKGEVSGLRKVGSFCQSFTNYSCEYKLFCIWRWCYCYPLQEHVSLLLPLSAWPLSAILIFHSLVAVLSKQPFKHDSWFSLKMLIWLQEDFFK